MSLLVPVPEPDVSVPEPEIELPDEPVCDWLDIEPDPLETPEPVPELELEPMLDPPLEPDDPLPPAPPAPPACARANPLTASAAADAIKY